MMQKRRGYRLIMTSFLALAASACDKPPPAEGLAVWSKADHDPANASGAQAAPGTGGGGAKEAVEMVWQRECARCHGMQGAGDGPEGQATGARNLQDPEWLRKTSDHDMAQAIQGGKNMMPAFELPDVVVRALVARIRAQGPSEAIRDGSPGDDAGAR